MTRIRHRQQTLPYLHRNWRTSVESLEARSKMVNGLNGIGDDDHDIRPAKRRRYLDSPDSGLGPDLDGVMLPHIPVDPHSAVRIDVLKISHKDDVSRAKHPVVLNANVPAVDTDVTTRARCTLTLNIPDKLTGRLTPVYCQRQLCSIRSSLNATAFPRMARVYLPQPFLIPQDDLLITRHGYMSNADDFADAYTIHIELATATANDEYWPPLNLGHQVLHDGVVMDTTSPWEWSIAAEVSDALDRGRRSSMLKVRKGGLAPDLKTNFVVDVDVRWTTSLPPKTCKAEQEQAYLAETADADLLEEPPALTNGHSNGLHTNGHLTNGHVTNGHVHSIEDDLDEDARGELTPSRALRVRANTNYNLKDLSSKAQGKEPRKRAKISGLQKADTERILYSLPREAMPVKEFVLNAFACCICYAKHQSLAQLRAHLFSHAQYNFQVNFAPGRPGYQLDVSYVGAEPSTFLRTKVYSLARPTTTFDLESYVDGDDSWAASRLGPNNKEENVAIPVRRKVLQPKAPRITIRTNVRSKQQLLQQQQQQAKKFRVPDTETSLFDPLSKSKLVPGSEVRRTLPDDSWLIQKHRDIVQDFSDVSASEKEYIKEWDAFIQSRRVVSEAFIGRALLEFVIEKVDWLLETKTRTLQFGKHLTVLVSRGVEDDTIKLVQAKLREARKQKVIGKQIRPAQPRKQTPKRKSKACAICGQAVRGPGLLICANENACKKPIYHSKCIRATARMPVKLRHWRCNDCTR